MSCTYSHWETQTVRGEKGHGEIRTCALSLSLSLTVLTEDCAIMSPKVTFHSHSSHAVRPDVIYDRGVSASQQASLRRKTSGQRGKGSSIKDESNQIILSRTGKVSTSVIFLS